MDPFRIYTEVGEDGYPPEWHATVKHLVREQAGHRCVRCRHPYAKGAGEWSPCDSDCDHAGPQRVWNYEFEEWIRVDPGPAMIGPGRLVEAQWRILTVHHLNGDKPDCRWWNLASLCQRCHLRIQRTVVMPRVFPYEHTEWFKPYAAGWYAFAYLGLELSREETFERLDELLALERVVYG